ncbi:MAG: hypothetical protein IKN72_08810 [Clostridia bacterium]|nr:hypothetical protein [Clostridia bacterium]MBR3553471.1 hypothetical protein [Clostridia bacterium]
MKTKMILGSLGVTMAVGGAALLARGAMQSPSWKKAYKKKAGKAIKAMEGMLDDVQDLLK